MAKAELVVKLDTKEITDAVLLMARNVVDFKSGGSHCEFIVDENKGVVGAVVTFQHSARV